MDMIALLGAIMTASEAVALVAVPTELVATTV